MSDVLFSSTVDNGRFSVTVMDVHPFRGQLVVRVVDTDEVILDSFVDVRFAAKFGADVDDIALWKEKALAAIDAYIDAHKHD